MHIKSIVAAAAIALVTGVGSVSADELYVADTAGDPGTPFAILNGIATSQMSDQDMAAIRGAAELRPAEFYLFLKDTSSSGIVPDSSLTLNYEPIVWSYRSYSDGYGDENKPTK